MFQALKRRQLELIRPLAFTASMLVALAVIGCSDDDKPVKTPDGTIPSTLVGTWTFQSATVDGVPAELRSILGWESSTTSARISISDAGSCVYEELNAQDSVVLTDSGDFSVAGDRFSVSPGTLPVDGGTWSVSGNQLTLSADLLGHPINVVAAMEE